MNNEQVQAAVFVKMQSLIPAELWAQHSHLSFGEMADVPALSPWADELRAAEKAWFAE